MSITNELNQIKNAVYGKEVRAAIHDAIRECYDDASVNHDNANMEVKMARGTHNTLNERLDANEQKLDEMNNQLSHLIIYPSGDDDTTLIQNAIDTGRNVLAIANATYTVTEPLRVRNSNQTIDFNNSLIIFNKNQSQPHTAGDARTNDVGIFDIKSYKEEVVQSVLAADLNVGEITLEGVNGLNVGDYIRLHFDCGEYSDSKLSPKINVLTEITSIDGNKISVNYSCTCWDVQGWETATVTKIIPQKNITIKNVKIKDETPLRNNFISNGNNPYPAEESHYACCGVGISHGVNITIENIEHTNGLFNTIHATNCYNCRFDSVTTKKPRLKSGGEGYCIQNINFHQMKINNICGYNTRHTLDFSCGGYAFVDGVKSYKSSSSDIQLHGQYEHDIEIRNANGSGEGEKFPYFNAGSGTTFGNASANVAFINSKLTLIASKDLTYISQLSFNDCDVIAHRLTNDVYFDNCYVRLNECVKKGILNRGGVTSRLSISNSTVELMTANECIAQFEQVEISGGKVINNLGQVREVTLEMVGCLDVTVNGVNKVDCGIKITHDASVYGDKVYKTNISNNNFYCYRYAGVWMNDITTSRHLTTISHNNFTKSNTTTEESCYCIDFDGNYKKDSQVKITISGNNALNLVNNINLLNNNSNAQCKCYGNNGIDDLTKTL